MAIIGFNFNKINAVKNVSTYSGNIEVNHSINISSVERSKLNMGTSSNDNVLKVGFNFIVVYGNNIGKIEVSGEILYTDTKEIIDETEKEWKANNRLSKVVNENVLRFVYGKTIIKVLEFSDLLGLPTPIPLPQLTFEEQSPAKKK